MSFIAEVRGSGTASQASSVELLRATRHAQFLFPRQAPIVDAIDELYDQSAKLRVIWDRSVSPSQARRDEAMDEFEKIEPWFKEQRGKMAELFEPFLRLED